ncbi:GFA family protein [Aspergillus novofumigatus IBT 16806]|uniref:CENP-V/GFA domain-containing protein n=1 Tax=Aspergillus novofumigatus (strain IBT 16806) TaxID=1392255 RepID=A0A2I1BTA7_ASPN1|nr:uncharacterized protein P174DRAFT_516293 [Aspergillus novofumigatus IBT 16806]PKX88647.1 hypothetical protein P174DRAFT_516293 [Aspergillus novofumigatus IBT 16806]
MVLNHIEHSADPTPASSVLDADKLKPYIPLASLANDGWSRDNEATATCYCGTVQIAFPTVGPGFLYAFVCNCTDCRKITASMFASNFVIKDEHLKHIRGQSNLKTFSQNKTIASHAVMTNYFCNTCGSLMYRVADRLPGASILRLGTVDDFNLVETRLKPTIEIFVKDRVGWFTGVSGEEVERFNASPA